VIKGPAARTPSVAFEPRAFPPRPKMNHVPSRFATHGKPLKVSLAVAGKPPATIRLHYRAVDHTRPFKTLEGGPAFTIPGDDVPGNFDLMYYFEVLNDQKSGWFFPDPMSATPYFIVDTQPQKEST
jgi:hypothetical protein